MKRTLAITSVLLLAALLLTGCGEKKQYEAAAALEAEGQYYDAYLAYHELRSYEDSRQKEQEMKEAVFDAARTAFEESRYDEAAEWASYFSDDPDMKRIWDYAWSANNGTGISDLRLSEDGKLSFTATVGQQTGYEDGAARIQIVLNTDGNGRAKGYVFSAEGKKTDNTDYFTASDYWTDGKYVISDLPLGSLVYDTVNKGLCVADFNEFADMTLYIMHIAEAAGYPIAYRAILNDGTELAALSEWACTPLRFRDPMKTFAGGTVSVRILANHGDEPLFEQTVDIPAE